MRGFPSHRRATSTEALCANLIAGAAAFAVAVFLLVKAGGA